jgi:O-antigen/teichoic acid export membrane protein
VTFIANILLARKFGPVEFGIFSLAISVMMVVNLIADLGLNLTMVRYFNLYREEARKQHLLVASLLILRFSLIVAIAVVAVPVGMLLASVFGLSGPYVLLLSLAIVAGGLLSLWVYLQNYLQANKRFRKLAGYIFSYGLFRILFFYIMYLLYIKQPTPSGALSALYIIPVAVVIVLGVLPLVRRILAGRLPSRNVIKEYVLAAIKYSKWVAISGICNSLIYRAVQFVLASRASKYELGILSAGFVFTVAFATLNYAVRAVFFPYITSLERIEDVGRHLSNVRKILPYYVALIVCGIIVLMIVQIYFLGEEYVHALPVFLISSTALAFTIFMGMISMLLHTFMRPEIDAFVNIARLLAATILAFSLTPILGALGGAVAYSIPLILGEIYIALTVRKLIYASK